MQKRAAIIEGLNDRSQVAFAAYLVAACKISERAAAAQLGLSGQRAVRELLERARAYGFYEVPPSAPIFYRAIVGDDVMAEIHVRMNDRALLERLAFATQEPVRKRLHTVRVFDVKGRDNEARIASLSKRATTYLAEQFSLSRGGVGLAWGGTVSAVIREMDSPGIARRLALPTVAPLAPDAPGEAVFRSATVLADRLSRLAASDPERQTPSLLGMPAFHEADERVRRKTWVNHSEIFGPKGLVEKIDCVLTSVSPEREPFGRRLKELAIASRRSEEEVKSMFLGDVAGVLLEIENLSTRERGVVAELKQRWTGISAEQLSSIAARAAVEKAPGVIVIATGASKAAVVLAAVKRGLVNQLVIDGLLRRALLTRLASS